MNSVGPVETSSQVATRNATAEASRRATTTGVLVLQRPAVYQCLWALLLTLHVVHAVGYSYEAWEYSMIAVNGSDLNKLLRVFRLDHFFRSSVATCVLLTSAAVAAIHTYSLVRALVWSIRLRRLVFFAKSPAPKLLTSETNSPEPKRIYAYVLQRLRQAWAILFDMDSDHFDAVRDVRKVVEIASQTYSMYVMGKTISNTALYVYVGISLTLNCWSTALVRYLWLRDESCRRYFRLLVGVLLGCCFTIVSPLVGYIELKSIQGQPQWFDVAWATNFLTQLQELMIDTWLELIASRLNALVITFSIETLKQRVQCASIYTGPSGIRHVPIAPCDGNPTPTKAVGIVQATSVRSLVAVGPQGNHRRRYLFLGYGAAILTITVHSLTRSPFLVQRSNGGGVTCHVEVQPWLQRHSSCLALEINCKKMGVSGSATEIAAELKSVETHQIMALIISNCVHLEMPHELQLLSSLSSLEIFNSKIQTWNESAAIVSSLQPDFVTLRMVLVTGIRELPLGLQVPTFPASDVEFTLTDLASLPSDLHHKWPQLIERLTIEGSRLTKIPDTLLNFEIKWLFLGSNRIQQVPASLFLNHSYSALMLSGNPIRELPASLGLPDNNSSTPGSCDQLLLHLTSIQEIPKWTKGSVTEVYAGSTPFCLTNRSNSWTSIDREAPKINCTPLATPVAVSFPVLKLVQKREPELMQVLLKKMDG